MHQGVLAKRQGNTRARPVRGVVSCKARIPGNTQSPARDAVGTNVGTSVSSGAIHSRPKTTSDLRLADPTGPARTCQPRGHAPLKVETRVRTPLGLLTKPQVRATECPLAEEPAPPACRICAASSRARRARGPHDRAARRSAAPASWCWCGRAERDEHRVRTGLQRQRRAGVPQLAEPEPFEGRTRERGLAPEYLRTCMCVGRRGSRSTANALSPARRRLPRSALLGRCLPRRRLPRSALLGRGLPLRRLPRSALLGRGLTRGLLCW
jgi:hypothetical protein